MNESSVKPGNKRNIWLRGLFMLLMFFAFQVSGTVLCIVTVIQFVMVLLSQKPNERLLLFGRSLGRYLQQIADFQAFATEEMPFPFKDWPSVY
ncbi:MAG: DUF4389 domain-containing protein [Gallionella sp.]